MVRTGEEASFVAPTQGADINSLQVTITDPQGNSVDYKRQRTPSGNVKVRWQPRSNGPHQIRALLGNQSLPGFPSTEIAFDPNAVRVKSLTAAPIMRQPVRFEVDTYDAGTGQLTAAVEHLKSGSMQAAQCSEMTPFIHSVTFTPTKAGEHELQLFLNGQLSGKIQRFDVTSEIETVLVSEDDVSVSNGRVERNPSNNSGFRARIAVNANLNELDFTMPATDYADETLKSQKADNRGDTMRSDKSYSGSLHRQPVRPVQVQLPKYVPIHHTVEFLISGVLARDKFVVHVQDPLGQKQQCSNRRRDDDLFVTFTPRLSGAHRFYVEVNGRYVSDLDQPPFCLAFDWTRIVSKLKTPVGFLDQPVILEVDASKCGGGVVECRVQRQESTMQRNSRVDGDTVSIASGVSGKVEAGTREYGSLIVSKPDDRYVISFNPDKAGMYELHVSYDGFPVPDSPFVVPVVDMNELRLTGQGLRAAPIFSVAWYRIELLDGPSQHLSVTVTNPQGIGMDCTLSRWSEGLMCEWTTDMVGVYYLKVFLGDRQLDSESFRCHAYDISKVKVTAYDKVGLCGQPMRFEVSADGASGDGQSEIAAYVLPLTEWKQVQEARGDLLTAEWPALPLKVQQKRAGLIAEFVPTEGQQHVIEIFFNEQSLPQCPIMLYVFSEIDVLNQMPLPTMPWVPVRVECCVSFIAKFEGFSLPISSERTAVTVKGPSGGAVPNRVVINKDHLDVYFTPLEAGLHDVKMNYGGQPLKWSPLNVNAYDIDSLRITYEPKITIARTATVTVDFSRAGAAPLQLKVKPPSGSHLAVQENFSQSGTVQFGYVPAEIGAHQLTLLFNGAEVEGCPFQQIAQSAEMAVAHGEGLVEAQVGHQAEFFVDPKGQKGELMIKVDGPTSVTACEINPTNSGLYTVCYNPPEVGCYSVTALWNGEPIPGSPFAPIVVDPSSIRCVAGGPPDGSSELQQLEVGRERTLVFDTSRAGPGRLSASVDGPSEPVQCQQRADTISFTPQAAGRHVVHVWFGDQPVPDTPYTGNALAYLPESDHTKVVLSGRGLREARIKEEAVFLIDGSQAGAGHPSVLLEAVSSNVVVKVNVRKIREDKFRCCYTAMEPGVYQLYVSWSERQLRGSPFRVTVSGRSDANHVVCSGEGLRQGILGREVRALIDTRRAGDGQLTAQCNGPSLPAACDIRDRGNDMFDLFIRPQEAGNHTLLIFFNGDHAPGSPFSLRVSPPPDASRVRVYGPGVHHGVIGNFSSSFVCETRGAGAGELAVRVRGPKGAFQVEMEREYQKERTINCRYDPTEAGQYQLIVKWSGEHVPGSPFNVLLFESASELNEYLRLNPHETRVGHSNGSRAMNF